MKQVILVRLTLFATLLPLSLLGASVTALPTLPQGELPNSEVSTNIVLTIDYARLRSLTLSLELDASASNSLSIAVGTAHGDSLSIEEADFEWGYDCGRWFRADTGTGAVEEWAETGAGRVSRSLTIDRRDFNPQWNRLRIIKRGVDDLAVEAFRSVENKKFSIRLR